MASVSRPGHEASLHLDGGTQQLWLAEHRTGSHGEDWTAASTRDAVTTSFAQGTLIVGGLLSPPIVRVEAVVGDGDRVQRPSPVAQEAGWRSSMASSCRSNASSAAWTTRGRASRKARWIFPWTPRRAPPAVWRTPADASRSGSDTASGACQKARTPTRSAAAAVLCSACVLVVL